jgi:hypothetical protein
MGAVEEVGAGTGAKPGGLEEVTAAARSAVQQEFQIAERLDAKARNQVAVGGAWFALVQAVASIALKQYLDHGGDRELFKVLVVLAGLAAATLAVSILYAYGVWKLRDEQEITHTSLAEMAAAARDPHTDLLEQFVQHYGYILWTRRENNKIRAKNLTKATRWWIGAVFLGLVELVVALAVVAQS